MDIQKKKRVYQTRFLHFYSSQCRAFVVLHPVREGVPDRAAQYLAAASIFLVRLDHCVGGSGILLSEADAEKPEHRCFNWRTE